MTIRLRPQVLGWGMLVLLLLAGCGGKEQGDYVSWQQYNAEYFRTACKLRLPPGYGWPPEAPGPRATDGCSNRYEVGCGRNDAEGYWFRTWARAWLKRRTSNPSAARRALAQLEKVTGTYMYRVSCDAVSKKWYGDMLQRARHGDSSLVRQDQLYNAPKYYVLGGDRGNPRLGRIMGSSGL